MYLFQTKSSYECDHQRHNPSYETWQEIGIFFEKRIMKETGKLCSWISKRTAYEGSKRQE